VLDPRVAYMVTNLLQEVLRSGTGASARTRGFTLPAAGKTGTSRDAWFAGFTTRLLCVVWVGFDDNTELPLEGAHAALPIWTEFMKRAHRFREYRNVTEFPQPDGVLTAQIDPLSGKLATSGCPRTVAEVFITGTQPVEYCPLHGGAGRALIAGWDTPEAGATAEGEAARPATGRGTAHREAGKHAAQPVPPNSSETPQRRGFWDRIKSIFK